MRRKRRDEEEENQSMHTVCINQSIILNVYMT